MWRLLQDALLGTFGALTGPEPVLSYGKPDTVPGAWLPEEGEEPVEDSSRKYTVAVPAHRVDELRALLRRAGNSFDQRVMYLEVGGYAEFWEVRPEDGFLEVEPVRETTPGHRPGREATMKRRLFQTITGRALDLERLDANERQFLAAVQRRYKKEPTWSEFAAWWPKALQRSGLSAESVAYRICQDLEARLGIAQGKISAPDYRDYLADLIDERYGSRYRFCRATGTDPGHLSRILAGRSELSLQTLQRLLEQLDAVLVIEPGKASTERFSRERAVRALAAAAR